MSEMNLDSWNPQVQNVIKQIDDQRVNTGKLLYINSSGEVDTINKGGQVQTVNFVECDQTINDGSGAVYLVRIPISADIDVVGFTAFFNSLTTSGVYGLGCYDYDGTDWTLVAQNQNTATAAGEFICSGGPVTFTSGLGKFMAFHQPSDSTLVAALRVEALQSGNFSAFKTSTTYTTAQGMPSTILAAQAGPQTQAPFGLIRY